MTERADGSIEVTIAYIKQKTLAAASAASEDQSAKVRRGNVVAARESAQRFDRLLKQYGQVDLLLPKFLKDLSEIGVSQPSIEDVYRFYMEGIARKKLEEAEPVEPTVKTREKRPGKKRAVEKLPISFSIYSNDIELGGNVIQLNDNERVLLMHLVKKSGEKVSAGDLAVDVFGSAGKNRARLTKTVFTIRRKLGETAKEQRFIRSEGKGTQGTFYWFDAGGAQGPDDEKGEEGSTESGNRLTDDEIYWLARFIKEDRADLVANEEDRARLESILEKYRGSEATIEETHEGLSKKLRAFFEDKEEILEANSANEDAQFLLAAIAVLESEEEQKKLAEERTSDGENEQRYFEHGLFKLDRVLHSLVIDGQQVRLAPIGFKILDLLCRNQGKLLTYEDFNRAVWQFADSTGVNKLLKVQIRLLRKKIKRSSNIELPIKAVRGAGYVFED